MDHIFGDSDDISFGNNSSPVSRDTSFPSKKPVSKPVFQKRELTPRPASSLVKRTPPSQDRAQTPVLAFQDVLPLVRLVQGMKSSFLPQMENSLATRIVPLSSSDMVDPLFLVRRDDTTVLIGSGFSNVVRAGKEYPTFPDMRLLFSEKDRIHAWILLDDSIDISLFLTILPALNFPPLYATRSVITKFRNTVTDQSFLDSCRFFELFADDMSERRIGDIFATASVIQ